MIGERVIQDPEYQPLVCPAVRSGFFVLPPGMGKEGAVPSSPFTRFSAPRLPVLRARP